MKRDLHLKLTGGYHNVLLAPFLGQKELEFSMRNMWSEKGTLKDWLSNPKCVISG